MSILNKVFVLKGPVLIVGRAKSGEAVAQLLKETQPQAEIAFYDENAERSDFANLREVLSKKWSHVVLSPGFPDQAWFQQLTDAGAVLTQELDVAAAYLGDEKVYAITGSVGKSTCAWIAKEVLSKLGKKVFLGGNFGIPMAEYALKKLKGEASADFVILELSSYQIERMAFMVDRALFLNFLPNHLDRYPDLNAYYSSKLRLLNFCREGSWALKTGGDLYTFAQAQGVESKFKWIESQDFESLFKDSRLIGKHNHANLGAVMEFLASPLLEISSFAAALNEVESLPHRIEFFEHKNIFFINDSKATTVEGVLTAYTALRERFEKQKFFWLLGGRDKKLPWQRLKRLWTDKNLSFLFFGESAEHVKIETGFEGQTFATLDEAMAYLSTRTLPDDVVVLSPAGTSLDEFSGFEERGDFFKSYALSKF